MYVPNNRGYFLVFMLRDDGTVLALCHNLYSLIQHLLQLWLHFIA